jgi:hypothetical protein
VERLDRSVAAPTDGEAIMSLHVEDRGRLPADEALAGLLEV